MRRSLLSVPGRPGSQRRHRPDWQRAVRSLRALLRDPESTRHALEVSYALDGDMAHRRLLRFLAHREGRRLFSERPSLLRVLSDRAALSAMPDGSFGRAYLEHMERNGFEPASLVALRRAHDPVQDRDAGERWFAERSDLLHDLWHVLTGYGADGAGEAALLPFSLAQYGGRANALLSVGAALEIWGRFHGRGWPRYVWRAWRRGRRAVRLDLLRYEELLAFPLDEVRRAVGIEAPETVHPQGVLVSRDAQAAAA